MQNIEKLGRIDSVPNIKDILKIRKEKFDATDLFEDGKVTMTKSKLRGYPVYEDNVYIGCMLGTVRTDCALMLNHFFNPKASITPDCITMINRCYLDKLETLYKNLTEANKRELGWTKEFEAAFMPRLRKAINNSKHMTW